MSDDIIGIKQFQLEAIYQALISVKYKISTYFVKFRCVYPTKKVEWLVKKTILINNVYGYA